jgi:hypothetical protein
MGMPPVTRYWLIRLYSIDLGLPARELVFCPRQIAVEPLSPAKALFHSFAQNKGQIP